MIWPELELFRQACGASGSLELEFLQANHEGPQPCTIEQPFVLLGRDPDGPVSVRADRDSHCQVYLQVIGGKVFFASLGSRTRITYQGRPRRQGWLAPGQFLQVDSSIVRLCSDQRPGQSLTAAVTGNPTLSLPEGLPLEPGVTLEIAGSEGRQIRWRMNRVLTMAGRESGCQLKTPDPDVSAYHCSLLHTPLGVWVIDLLSHTGTILNGQRVRWARLADGDRLHLGSYVIRPWYDDEGKGRGSASALQTTNPGGLPSSDYLLPAGIPSERQLIVAGSGQGAHPQDALLLPLVEQFQSMQQQMFDQFHQTMLMMVQMFCTMHREQMSCIRDELDHVQCLTRELQELQAELRQVTATGEPAPRPQSAPPTPARLDQRTPAPKPAKPAKTPATDKPLSPAATGPAPAEKTPQASGDSPRDANVHAWLRERIAALHAERQGRWQKIMKFVMGK
jgi:hypothetical protein